MSYSDRHAGDLGGRLRPFGDSTAGVVSILIEEATAHRRSVQHTAWMLVNLLPRMAGLVEGVIVEAPTDIELMPNVIPFAPSGLSLSEGLAVGGGAIGIAPVSLSSVAHPTLVVGPGEARAESLRCYGEGWLGGVSRNDVQPFPESPLPLGPYVAAALATGQIFLGARNPNYAPIEDAWYCTWTHRGGTAIAPTGPNEIVVDLAHSLIGVGAVGSTLIHALWATPSAGGTVQLVDGDPEGIDSTNLNRYPLFGRGSVGKMKGREAARIADGCSITWVPVDKAFEVAVQEPGISSRRVISAVDKNIPRHAIQRLYPDELLSASTLELRAEVLRCGPPGVGACLACHNPPEKQVTDQELRRQVGGLSDAEAQEIAAATGLTREELADWASTGKCGRLTPALMAHLRAGSDLPADFAVSFVSAMSGTLLAAELLKSDSQAPALGDDAQRASFTFWKPDDARNGASIYLRDPSCPLCIPGSPGVWVWQGRSSRARKG